MEENELTEPSAPTEDEFEDLVSTDDELESTAEDSQADEVVEKTETPAPTADKITPVNDVLAVARETQKANAEIDAFKGVINQFTGEEIKDGLDVAEYKTMLEIQKSGGDPLADYAKTVKQKTREAESKKGGEGQGGDFMTSDADAFGKANPDVDITKLFTDDKFMRFAGARFGKESMTSIYNDWIFVAGEFSKTAEKTAKAKAESIVAKTKASPGSLGGGVVEEKVSPDEYMRLALAGKLD